MLTRHVMCYLLLDSSPLQNSDARAFLCVVRVSRRLFRVCSGDEGASSVLPSGLDAELGFRFASVTTGSWTYYVEPGFDGV